MEDRVILRFKKIKNEEIFGFHIYQIKSENFLDDKKAIPGK